MHLGCIKLAIKVAVDGDIDRYPSTGRMRASDGCDVVQRVGEAYARDLYCAGTRVDQEIGGETLETRGFLRRDREHFLSFCFVLPGPGGGRQGTRNHRDRISDLVRNCSGQSTDRGKLLLREQLLAGMVEFLEIAYE